MKRLSYFFSMPHVKYSDCALHKTSTYSAHLLVFTVRTAERLIAEKQETGTPWLVPGPPHLPGQRAAGQQPEDPLRLLHPFLCTQYKEVIHFSSSLLP